MLKNESSVKKPLVTEPLAKRSKQPLARVLPISEAKSLSRQDKKAIELFNARCDSRQMRLEQKNGSLNLLLTEADIYSLKNLVEEISSDSELPKNVLAKVESLKSYAVKAGKRQYVGYNKERKVKGRSAKVEKRGQYFYAKGEQGAEVFDKCNQQVPRKYIDKILCADSQKLLQKLPDNSVDLIFTSPPYNFGLDYQQGEDDKAWQKYFEKLFAIFDQCIRVVKYGGRIIVNIQPLFSDYIPAHHMISQHFIKRKMIWRGEILWEKNNYNCKYTAWGSWKSPSNPYLKYTWEFLEVFCKGSLKKDGAREDIDISADEFKKWVNAKWSIAPERDMAKYGHPAMFPQELAQRVLKLFSYRGDVVLDPFNGLGTTCLVAKKLQRSYIGIDVSKDYCRLASERLAELECEGKHKAGADANAENNAEFNAEANANSCAERMMRVG